MDKLSNTYLTKNQAIEKYTFLTSNMLKNILFKDIGGFRNKVVVKLGRRVLLDEQALLKFLAENKEGGIHE
jgi:hypothetical protein